MRNDTTEKNASFAFAAKAPVDIKYRSERATMSLLEVLKFVNAIDPSTLPDGVHEEVLTRIEALGESLGKVEAGRPSTKNEAKAGRTTTPAAPKVKPQVTTAEDLQVLADCMVAASKSEDEVTLSPEEQIRKMGEAIRDEEGGLLAAVNQPGRPE